MCYHAHFNHQHYSTSSLFLNTEPHVKSRFDSNQTFQSCFPDLRTESFGTPLLSIIMDLNTCRHWLCAFNTCKSNVLRGASSKHTNNNDGDNIKSAPNGTVTNNDDSSMHSAHSGTGGSSERATPVVRREPENRVTQSSPGTPTGNHHNSNSNSCEDVIPPAKNCYRLVVLGSARVGKTSLVSRFLGGKFVDSYTPTIEDFHRKLYRIRSEIHQLDILDTSGNHPFPAMRRLSFLTGDLFVIVFSMDSRETFEEAVRLREQILETKVNAGAASNSGLTRKKFVPRVPMVLAGNKCDKDMRTVTTEEAIAYCETQDSGCVFVETSAKKNYNVNDIFYELFLVANLPQEMAPGHHKRVSASFGAPCPLPPPGSHSSHHSNMKKYTLSVKRRLSDACGVVTPNVRRPSIRTDLMIMRTKQCGGGTVGGANDSNIVNGRKGSCMIQ